MNDLGSTAFPLDYASNYDVHLLGDSGKSVGLFAFQNWDEVGLYFYTGYCLYEVQRPDIDFNTLDLIVAAKYSGSRPQYSYSTQPRTSLIIDHRAGLSTFLAPPSIQ